MRVVFAFILGALIALFVGFGIHTLYPPPERPSTGGIEMKTNPTDEVVARVAASEAAYKVEFPAYSRNVSVASMCGAMLLLGASPLLERRNKVMANGYCSAVSSRSSTASCGVRVGTPPRCSSPVTVALLIVLSRIPRLRPPPR